MFGLRRLLLEGRAARAARGLEGIEAVTADDVQRLAADIVRPERLSLAAIGPLDEEPLAHALDRAA